MAARDQSCKTDDGASSGEAALKALVRLLARQAAKEALSALSKTKKPGAFEGDER
jgi:hypothetical protein